MIPGASKYLFQIQKRQTFGTLIFDSIIMGGFTITHPRFTTFALMKIADEAIIGHPLMQYLGMVLNLSEDKGAITRIQG